jgi:hypothetical protein
MARKQLIRELLEKGDLTVKQIADKAACTTGYVYQLRTQFEREKFVAQQPTLINRPFPIQQPKPASDLQMAILAVAVLVVVWFLTVVVFSFYK